MGALVLVVGCADVDEVVPAANAGTDGTTGTASTGELDDALQTTDHSDSAQTDGADASTGLAQGSSDEGGTGEELLGPPYPIVLAHGFFGFDDFAGTGFVHYWWGVPEHLDAMGEHDVFVTTVDPFNDSTVRGEMLLEQVEMILAETGHAKVNLMGHSQGGLDARVVASLRPDLVASVTTIATPHHGTPIADIVLGLVDDPAALDLADWVVQTLGGPVWDDVGTQTSIAAAMHQFSQPGIDAFNETYIDGPGVTYYSIAGRSDRSDGGFPCEQADDPPTFITDFDGELDPIDPMFAVPEAIIDGGTFSEVPNDGLTRVSDAKWGRFLGCIPADHLDQVGHLLGDEPGTFNDWDHLAFYAALTTFLRTEGH